MKINSGPNQNNNNLNPLQFLSIPNLKELEMIIT